MMTTKLRSELYQNGSGSAEIVTSAGWVVANIKWHSICIEGACLPAATPGDVLKLARLRLQDEQKGDMASPSKAKAIALLMQVEAELDGGQKTLDDGTPILGASE